MVSTAKTETNETIHIHTHRQTLKTIKKKKLKFLAF